MKTYFFTISLATVVLAGRYYNPDVATFISVDPAQEFYNAYSYTGGDPVNLVDPNGLSTITDDKGNVVNVISDGDFGVFSGPIGVGALQGETPFLDEFSVGDHINFGNNVTFLMRCYQTTLVFDNNPIQVAIHSAPDGFLKVGTGLLDVKTKLGAGEGYLFNGQYYTGKSIGNYIAGQNAAYLKQSWLATNLSAGVLHLLTPANIKQLWLGSTLKYFGETNYAGRQIESGYKSVTPGN